MKKLMTLLLEHLPVRNALRMARFVVFPLGIIIIAGIAFVTWDWLIIAAFPFLYFLMEAIDEVFVCPKCKKSVQLGVMILGIKFVSPFTTRRCVHCNADLEAKAKPNTSRS